MTNTVHPAPPLGKGSIHVPSFLACIFLGLAVWFAPRPAALSAEAWQLFAIFVATILGIILRPLPVGAVALFAAAVLLVTKTMGVKETFAGFGDPVAWLVVYAFFIARGFIKTGLGRRLAFFFVRLLGRHTLGLGYGLVVTDLALAPFIPSVTARAAGILFPILRGLADAFESKPRDPSSRRMASFLTLVTFQGTVITSAMFLTAMAGNPVVARLAADAGIEITWAGWAQAAIVPGLCSLIVMPLVLYFIYPPEIKHTPHAVDMAKNELASMGPMSGQEWSMLATLGVLLTLWAGGGYFGIAAVTTALVGLCILFVAGVLEGKDILKEEAAWGTFVWFSVLMMMAGSLRSMGFTGWFADQMVGFVSGMDWRHGLLALLLVYFYTHYFFASMTAHIYSLYPPFLAVSLGIGAPPMFAALGLAFVSCLCGGLTHYGSSPAPLLFGAGYVSVQDWWRNGAILSILNLTIWVVIGGMWWKLLGLW